MKRHLTLKTAFTALLLILTSVMPAFALSSTKKAAEYPYRIELDIDPEERLCYAGHRGDVINYMPGRAVTPETEFRLTALSADDKESSRDVLLEIAVLYETDEKRASREVIRRYDYGDISLNESYRIFSDLNISNLEERDRLYSDSLKGLEFKITYRTKDQTKKKDKCYYFHVCPEEEYEEYLEKILEEAEEADEAE